ncbi:MAG: hypothetical protein FWE44_06205 [Defluviitaleaceae bacterium]|nr:hypothetical protein [Defluviitaleaceae bacterium]
MIISNNREPSLKEFQGLVDLTTLRLNDDAKNRIAYYTKRNAQLLEDDVKGFLEVASVGTKFEGSIEKISGQRFPDIVASKYYGVEVKSSKDDKWISLGGSINESTRVQGVERIFLTFGKLTSPVEFRSRPYEDCLSEVVVTHYPRYKIDMNLTNGKTIFNKMGTSYDTLRKSSDPVAAVVDYYKNQLSDGESLWWTGKKKQVEALPMKVRLLRTLSISEKREIMISGFAYFPNLMGNASTKYERFSLWLATAHGVVSTSTRDAFSAGGQGKIEIDNMQFEKVPRKIINIYDNAINIEKCILNTDKEILKENWRIDFISSDRMGQWLELASQYCSNDEFIILAAIFGR